jgi:hypothetical protein
MITHPFVYLPGGIIGLLLCAFYFLRRGGWKKHPNHVTFKVIMLFTCAQGAVQATLLAATYFWPDLEELIPERRLYCLIIGVVMVYILIDQIRRTLR